MVKFYFTKHFSKFPILLKFPNKKMPKSTFYEEFRTKKKQSQKSTNVSALIRCLSGGEYEKVSTNLRKSVRIYACFRSLS